MQRTVIVFSALILLTACGTSDGTGKKGDGGVDTVSMADTFTWQTDQFADVRVLRYPIPGWDSLSLRQKELAYYLTMAGLSGRDIIWDQNYHFDLRIRRALEKVISGYKGDKASGPWTQFMLYAKQVFFHNGIYHHYSQDKIMPTFERSWFEEQMKGTGASLAAEVLDAMFDPTIDAKKVSLDEKKDLVLASAVNFYGDDVNQREVEAFYAGLPAKGDTTPISYGLNSKLVRKDGKLVEQVWKVGGMYDGALKEMVRWLTLAQGVAESREQAHVIGLLIEFYGTGDLHKWDEFNIAWALQKNNAIDLIQGFIEVYNDPMGKRGSYECSVEIIDPVATGHMRVIQDNAQWFEDNSPIMAEHKKAKVTGITYGFANVANEAGDAAPSTAIGVNLPNADWIRKDYGSKSVSFGNIMQAYDRSSGPAALDEFCNDSQEVALAKKYGALAGDLHTALHEVIGHASGRIERNVGPMDQTLKSYASTLEEGRADLVALYYIMDPKLVDWGVTPSLEVGKAGYDAYIRNGLVVQLRRLVLGQDLEESHMRNRQWISKWCLEKGAQDSVIVVNVRDGKIYYDIRDYGKLRVLFGELLREVQRIKSQGDLQAAHDLVEGYGVKVDPALHEQVLERSRKITTAPYAGFIQPVLVPVLDADGKITDVRVEYPMDFVQQMLMYGAKFSFLPDEN